MEEISRKKSWFSRNWKWAVPVGGCLVIIIAFVIFAGSMIFGLTSLFQGSTPYKQALELAQSNPQVIEKLGEPVEKNGALKGSFTLSNNEGHANFDIPIKGSKGNAILYIDADKQGDAWIYHTLEVVLDKTLDTIRIASPNIPQ